MQLQGNSHPLPARRGPPFWESEVVPLSWVWLAVGLQSLVWEERIHFRVYVGHRRCSSLLPSGLLGPGRRQRKGTVGAPTVEVRMLWGHRGARSNPLTFISPRTEIKSCEIHIAQQCLVDFPLWEHEGGLNSPSSSAWVKMKASRRKGHHHLVDTG